MSKTFSARWQARQLGLMDGSGQVTITPSTKSGWFVGDSEQLGKFILIPVEEYAEGEAATALEGISMLQAM
jgi:hypothetical protein